MVMLLAVSGGRLGLMEMVCTPAPGMAKLMVVGVPWAPCTLASAMAARRVQVLGLPGTHWPPVGVPSALVLTVNTVCVAASGAAIPIAAATWSSGLRPWGSAGLSAKGSVGAPGPE